MVAEQRETVQRIDADTIDIASNVSRGQQELLKYYASISSNRWLMLKVFGILIVFVSYCPSRNVLFELNRHCVVFGLYSRFIVVFYGAGAWIFIGPFTYGNHAYVYIMHARRMVTASK